MNVRWLEQKAELWSGNSRSNPVTGYAFTETGCGIYRNWVCAEWLSSYNESSYMLLQCRSSCLSYICKFCSSRAVFSSLLHTQSSCDVLAARLPVAQLCPFLWPLVSSSSTSLPYSLLWRHGMSVEQQVIQFVLCDDTSVEANRMRSKIDWQTRFHSLKVVEHQSFVCTSLQIGWVGGEP